MVCGVLAKDGPQGQRQLGILAIITLGLFTVPGAAGYRMRRRLTDCEGSQSRKSGARKPRRGPPHCVVVGSLEESIRARSLRRRLSSAGDMRPRSRSERQPPADLPERLSLYDASGLGSTHRRRRHAGRVASAGQSCDGGRRGRASAWGHIRPLGQGPGSAGREGKRHLEGLAVALALHHEAEPVERHEVGRLERVEPDVVHAHGDRRAAGARI